MEAKSNEALVEEIERLKKINKALMDRVERSVANTQNAFSLFEGNILLAGQVKKRTEELEKMTTELEKEKSKVVRILKSLPGSIIIFNSQFLISDSFAHKVNPLILKKIYDLKDKCFKAEFKKELTKSFQKISQIRNVVGFTYSCIQNDFSLNCSVTQISEDRFMLFITDETENHRQQHIIKEQEAQILQSAKLSSLGEMAGGVAHEINTPLCTILILASHMATLAQRGNLDIDKTLDVAEKIKKTVNQISKIVNSLRQLSRNGDGDPMEGTHLKEAMFDAIELCRQKYKMRSVELIVEDSPEIKVWGRRVQIAQVILNLLNNSLQAVEGQENSWVKLKLTQNEQRVRLYIIDSGHGIPNEILSKIFNPFFTTKPIGEGTGLGMSISKRIMEDHKGKLEYELIDGNTSFYLEFKQYNLVSNAA